jgi:pimeloyl-ACP methyl ester carboxylesterase
MPQLTRNGAVIHWEERGEGPGLFIAHSMISMPSDFDALLGQLASEHRVVTYDPRGAGKSSRTGPYDITTDAEDMAAVIEEVGHPVVAVSLGYNPVPLGVVTTRPELVEAVVLVSPPRIGSREGAEDVSLFESDAVVEVMLEMMESNPQGLLRTIISMGNPQLSEAGVRERLEQQLAYGPPEVGVERGKAYLAYDATPACAALGRRLWIIHWESPLAPPDAFKRVRQRLPEAQLVEVEDGPISRPELTAEIVRKAAASISGSTEMPAPNVEQRRRTARQTRGGA